MKSVAAEATSTSTRYPSLVAFYNAEELRLSSREQDVGLWWRDGEGGALHRAAWIEETGELYLVRLGPPAEGGGAVEVLARVDDPRRLQRILAGWREHCGEPGSLQWLRMRARRLVALPSLARPRRSGGSPSLGATA